MSTDFVDFLPLGVLCYTLNNVLDKWNTRHKKYALIARAKVIHSIVRVVIQLSLVSLGGTGLIIGYISGFAISIIILYWNWLNATITSMKTTAASCYISLIKRYKNFPLFSAPSGLVSQMVDKMPSYALPFFGADVLGNYSMTSKVLNAPLGFLGISVSNVFFQRIANVRNDPKETNKLLVRAYLMLFLIIVVPMGVIFFYSEPVALLVLGPGWEKVGLYMKLLIPMQIMRFVVSPTSLSMQAFERQKEILLWMVAYLILSVITFVVGYGQGNDISTILAFSLISAFMYSIWIAMSLKNKNYNPASAD
jgi:O-antigen/teichoic acid export membrane protein